MKKAKFYVYPGHGVGKLIRKETTAGQQYLVLEILNTGMKIMVPQANIEATGLREVISRAKAVELLTRLQFETNGDVIPMDTWNRRYREYMDKIKTGSIDEICDVLIDLRALAKVKELSYGERNMLDVAKKLIETEVKIALGGVA